VFDTGTHVIRGVSVLHRIILFEIPLVVNLWANHNFDPENVTHFYIETLVNLVCKIIDKNDAREVFVISIHAGTNVTANYTPNNQNSCFPVNLFGEEEFVGRRDRITDLLHTTL
jgi:hypothetical protein